MGKYFAVFSRQSKGSRRSFEIESGLLDATDDDQALEAARDLIIQLNENAMSCAEDKLVKDKLVLRRVIKQVYP